ncbi:heterokaryon incompatibility protein-domain-containing protein [Tricladium varicosporioides]|nr:heterokaryon incompatibility protein-domain-containing protein [Hymenoscyphus varicosporioides]
MTQNAHNLLLSNKSPPSGDEDLGVRSTLIHATITTKVQMFDTCSTCVPQTSIPSGCFSVSDLVQSAPKGCRTCSVMLSGLRTLVAHLEDLSLFEFAIEHASFREYQDPLFLRIHMYSLENNKSLSQGILEIYTRPGTPPSSLCHEARNVTPDLSLDTAVAQITEWMTACRANHNACNKRLPILPSRILDVASVDKTGEIYLVNSSGKRSEYVTLSHCWGKNPNIITTTTHNIAQMESGIALPELSQTFQDAIRITNALKIRYIWIDSLCILQDCKTDWERHSSQMADIYSNSILNIAATSSPNGEGGLFNQRWTPGNSSQHSIQSFEVPGSQDFGSLHYIRYSLIRAHQDLAFNQVYNFACDTVTSAPLLTRGWVLQERLLSPRTVNFHTSEMTWDCESQFTCECGVFEIDPCLPRTHLGKHQWLSKRSLTEAAATKAVQRIMYRWHQLIEQYSTLHLTKDTDVLPAFSGVASHFGKLLESAEKHCDYGSKSPSWLTYQKTRMEAKPPPQYLAGLWRECLWRNLLWYVHATETTKRTDFYRAPTWSWASIDFHSSLLGPQGGCSEEHDASIKYIHGSFDEEPHFQVIYAECSVPGNNKFGEVSGGSLHVRGWILEVPMIWDRNSSTIEFSQEPVNTGFKFHARDCILLDSKTPSFPHSEEFLLPVLVLGISSNPDKPFRGIVLQRTDAPGEQYTRIGCYMIGNDPDAATFQIQATKSEVREIEVI